VELARNSVPEAPSVRDAEQPADTDPAAAGQPPSTINPKPSTITGGGEGGNIYRMRPDGTELNFWATGFWNPHASCIDAFGRLFTVDNDPDSRPPCRLLHVIEGGDYGYKFRNGRRGLHPFTSWNGEIPGTLPMVAGTGEAPSGILAYEHDAFPAEYLGNLLVTSWGDHRIDRFRLKAKGASFESLAEPVIVGGENFRPVGIALAPDGSFYISDWVLADYNLHGKGRVWRVRASEESPKPFSSSADWVAINSPRQVERRLAARRLAISIDENGRLSEYATDKGFPLSSRYEAIVATILAEQNESGEHVAPRDEDQLLGDLRIMSFLHGTTTHSRGEAIKTSLTTDKPSPSMMYLTLRLLDQKDTISRAPFTFATICQMLHVYDDPYLFTQSLSIRNFKTLAPRNHYEWTRWRMGGELFLESTASLRHARLGLLLARGVGSQNPEVAAAAMDDRDPGIRRLAVQWAAEEHMTDLRPQVEAVLKSEPMTTDLFLATLAALEMLDGKAPDQFDETPPGQYVLPLLADPAASAAVKAQALRLVDPADEGLTVALLESLFASDDAALRLEAVRSLALSPRPEAAPVLAKIAERRLLRAAAVDVTSDNDREELAAIVGLANHVGWAVPTIEEGATSPTDVVGTAHPTTSHQLARETLLNLLGGPLEFRADVVRSLRKLAAEDESVRVTLMDSVNVIGGDEAALQALSEQVALIAAASGHQGADAPRSPTTDEEWLAALARAPNEPGGSSPRSESPASAEAGERVFFHSNAARCYQCHTVNGRGGRIGPDLSRIGGAMSYDKLVDSILNPSKEVSPQFTNWAMVTHDGQTHTGMLVHENRGDTTLGDAEGKTVTLKTADIELRTPLDASVMPEKLEDRLTLTEFRDLVTFLQSLK
jgi:putative heme-binding domain-containing protein